MILREWSCISSVRTLVLMRNANSESTSASRGWATPRVPVLFVISVLLLAAFVSWEIRQEREKKPALLPLSIFFRPNARLGPVIGLVFFGWWNFNTMSYLMTLYYQQVLVLDPLQTAVRFLPMTIAAFILIVTTGHLIHMVPGPVLILVGLSGNIVHVPS